MKAYLTPAIIASAIIAFIILFITLAWPYIKDRIWGTHPNTYVCCWGMEHSYSLEQLRAKAPIRSKITKVPIQWPKGASPIPDTELPLKLFEWTYSSNEKLYTITVHNKGDGTAKNIKVDIDFTPSSISSLKINNEERVKLVRGGKQTGTRAIFEINELLPDEVQDIEILVEGKTIKSLNAWSESEGEIKNIFILDVLVEPDK
jgi:hypothetical protein